MDDLTSVSCLHPEFIVIHWLFSPSQHRPLNFKGTVFWDLCFSLVSVAAWPKATHRRKGFFLSLRSQLISEGSEGRNSRQEPGGRKWSRGHAGYGLAPYGFHCHLPYTPRTTCPGVVLLTVACVFPYRSRIKTMSHRLDYRSVLWRHFLS